MEANSRVEQNRAGCQEAQAKRSGASCVPCINCGGQGAFTSPEKDDWLTRTTEFNRRYIPRIDEERYEAADEAERDQRDAEYEVERAKWVLLRKWRELSDPAPDCDQDDPDEWPCPVCGGFGYQTLEAAERTLAERKRDLSRW